MSLHTLFLRRTLSKNHFVTLHLAIASNASLENPLDEPGAYTMMNCWTYARYCGGISAVRFYKEGELIYTYDVSDNTGTPRGQMAGRIRHVRQHIKRSTFKKPPPLKKNMAAPLNPSIFFSFCLPL